MDKKKSKQPFFLYSLIEIPFGDKDQRGECTLQQGDSVEFQIATDRRDKLQRATNIALLEETFSYSGEIRETVRVLLSICDLRFIIFDCIVQVFFSLTHAIYMYIFLLLKNLYFLSYSFHRA